MPATIDHAFVCGPHGVNDEAEAALLAAGVAPERIHIERFGIPDESGPGRAAVQPAREGDAADARVTIIRDGVSREIDFHAEQGNILDAAAAAGLEVPFSCKSGVCCTCRAKLLEGEVRMERNFALEKHEVAAGFVLTCQSHPLTERVVLSFDEALSHALGPRAPCRADAPAGYELQRETILARAAELFAQRGYTATSMNEVAEACGVSKPSLYHYVRDKHQLLRRDRRGARRAPAGARRRGRCGRGPRPSQRLRRLIDAFLAAYAGSQAEHRVLTEDVRFLAAGRAASASSAASAASSPRSPRRSPRSAPSSPRHALQQAAGDAAVRHDELDVHLAAAASGELSHADLAPVVADLFFGGLGAVRAPAREACPFHSHSTTETLHVLRSETPLARRSASRAAAALATSRTPTSTSA